MKIFPFPLILCAIVVRHFTFAYIKNERHFIILVLDNQSFIRDMLLPQHHLLTRSSLPPREMHRYGAAGVGTKHEDLCITDSGPPETIHLQEKH